MINVVDDYSTFSMLIIQDQQIMKFWYQDEFSKETLCIFSENEFTSDLIALQFLQHYVENSNSDSLKSWKLMLMNNHDSHMTSEFIKLTNDNHIRSFSLISHLTHCMQLLNVEIFQSYKHWHDVAIQKAFEEFNIEYSFFRFCHDFIKIRNNIFKSKIIRNAFRKSEMWSIDVSLCIDQLKKFKAFNNNESIRMRRDEQMIEQRDEQMRNATATRDQAHESTLSLSSRIRSLTIDDVQNELLEWLSKIQNITQWSDSARSNEFAEFVENAKEMIAKSHLQEFELKVLFKRRTDDLLQKIIFRQRLKSTTDKLELIKKTAEQAIVEKKDKKNRKKKKKKHRNFMIIWRRERKKMYVKEVIVRKKKKKRVKNVKELMKQNIFISDHLLISIENSEVTWKAIDSIWLAEKAKKKKVMRQRERAVMGAPAEEEDEEDEEDEANGANEADEADAQGADEEEMQFVIDTNSNQWLDQDFIGFDDDEDQEHVGWMGYE